MICSTSPRREPLAEVSSATRRPPCPGRATDRVQTVANFRDPLRRVCHHYNLVIIVVDVPTERHIRTTIWVFGNTDLRGRPAGSSCKTVRYRPPLIVRRIVSDSTPPRGRGGGGVWLGSWPLAHLLQSPRAPSRQPRVALMRLRRWSSGAAGAHPAQAGRREAEVAPTGRSCQWWPRSLPTTRPVPPLPPPAPAVLTRAASSCLVVPGQHLVSPAGEHSAMKSR